MSTEKFVAIGHIANDVVPTEHLGGGVAYAAVTARRLGMDAHIITKCPPDHPYIAELEGLGINVHVLLSKLETITTFDNTYDLEGKRRQRVPQVQEPISINHLRDMPSGVLKESLILIAPIIAEVEMNLIPELGEVGSVSVTPQGYFREIDEKGTVSQRKWVGFGEHIKSAPIVLSDEDITIAGQVDYALRKEIIDASPLVAITHGGDGVTIYQQGQEAVRTRAFPLKEDELVDFTGAGDVFATVFITEMTRNGGDLKAASVAACFFAAIKIMGINGIGIDSIPSRQQLKEFAENHPERINGYLEQEGVQTISLL